MPFVVSKSQQAPCLSKPRRCANYFAEASARIIYNSGLGFVGLNGRVGLGWVGLRGGISDKFLYKYLETQDGCKEVYALNTDLHTSNLTFEPVQHCA